MKLNEQEILDILATKRLTCSNINSYQNMDTLLNLTCENNHNMVASLRSIRNANFKCSVCDGNDSISNKIADVVPPIKEGYRVIAIDNATENIGLSIFDDSKLVFYHLFHITGETITRLLKNRNLLEDIIIEQWCPDLIVFEDIQYQSNIQTFKILAMLLGSSLVTTQKHNIRYETVLSKVWRSHFMINGKIRIEQKKQAIDKVKSMYNIAVNDDIAEAILLGKYSVDCLSRNETKKLF